MAHYRITKLTSVGFREEVTIEKKPGIFARFFGVKTRILKFQGSCTVWHEYPSGRNAGTMMEGVIHDLVVGYKMRNPIIH